jgi:hypothetical protein
MGRHQSERSPERGQAHDADDDPRSLENDPARVQPPHVRTAWTEQRSTERAEVGSDPNGDIPTHQFGGSPNAKEHSLQETKNADTKPDYTTGLDRITDVDHGEHQPEDRSNRARGEVTECGCRQRILLGLNLLAGIQR